MLPHRPVAVDTAVDTAVVRRGRGRGTAGRGVVVVAHPGGLRTTYEPVEPAVRAGQQVAAGSVLGRLAAAPRHCGEAPCLHWGARRGEAHVDPLALLVPAAPPVLLPLGRP